MQRSSPGPATQPKEIYYIIRRSATSTRQDRTKTNLLEVYKWVHEITKTGARHSAVNTQTACDEFWKRCP